MARHHASITVINVYIWNSARLLSSVTVSEGGHALGACRLSSGRGLKWKGGLRSGFNPRISIGPAGCRINRDYERKTSMTLWTSDSSSPEAYRRSMRRSRRLRRSRALRDSHAECVSAQGRGGGAR
jgi:hypothetical protein